ncbi:hypothetical protein GCM10023264_11590 [Sphingomonas daechungensis]|uniref:Winged helix DNA-binding protein n=1 Tax=Sphingomonas daechungensis TaxID=1176646 RepID=A0ABX6T031_9SPHN|nr:MarR family transcriptional regulator [Sphingomonas daechungensis]QNP42405.1 winged helix DNA-binding protein [Sphingomonas daechungensis]
MNRERPRPTSDEHRLISLDSRDIDDLRRLLAKLHPSGRGDDVSDAGDHGPERNDLVDKARVELDNRRKRVAIFGSQMFAEPAWEMLLLLFLSEGRQRITQSRLGELSGASRSTGLRWIDYLSDHGLAERREHPTDKRQNFVSLTEKGRALLSVYLSETK